MVGIAVFDVTKVAFPHQGLTWGVSYDHCKKIIQDKLKEIVDGFNFTLPFANNKNMIGVWVQIHNPSLNLSLGHPTTRFSSEFLIIAPPKGYRGKALKMFKEAYEVYGATP